MVKDGEPTQSEIEEELSEFFFSITNKLNASAPRYKSLLKLYKDNANNLLAQIHSRTTGVSRYNDTPQNFSSGGVAYEDDEHNTNVTKSEGDVYSDGLTLMSRLEEVQTKYRNLIEDWAREFKIFFISSYNYQKED